MTKCETLVYDASKTPPDVIQCLDESSECIIHCIGNAICFKKEIHCHKKSTISICKVSFNGSLSGQKALIYTHTSPVVFINATGRYAFVQGVIYGHETMNTELYVYAITPYSMTSVTIFSSVGEGSLLSMKCAGYACAYMKIYDDWTTEIYMEPFGSDGREFQRGEIRNIFDDSPLNISRSDSNYIGLNTDYRAPVFFNGCHQESSRSWSEFKYYGHNHGDLTLYGRGTYMFLNAIIYATADIAPYNGKQGYDIKLIANTTDDTLTGGYIFTYIILKTDGNAGTNIYVEVTDYMGFRHNTVYARDANLVNIYCHGGVCYNLTLYCPENNLNNTCRIYCDDDPNTQCRFIKMYSTNGYCKDAALLCVGNACDIEESKIYCGYDQTTNYCDFARAQPSWEFQCNNAGLGSCNNNFTEETCHNMLVDEPIAISTTLELSCHEFQTIATSDAPTTAVSSTTVPSITPTISSTNATSVSPRNTLIRATTSTSVVIPTNDPTITSSPSTDNPSVESTAPPAIDESIENGDLLSNSNTIKHLVIIISLVSVICVCILIFAHYVFMKRQESAIHDVVQVCVAQHNDNEQNNNSQHGNDASRDSNDSMYMTRNVIVTDYGTTTTGGDKDDQRECGVNRKEGEPTINGEVDDTDFGDV